MVIRHAPRLAIPGATLLLVLSLAGCGLFTVSPFPEFVDKTDISIDLGSRISAIAAGASPVKYDLNVIDRAGLPPRVLLLVNPPSSDPNAGFDYKGQLIFMDKDLNVLGQASPGGSLDYFSRPYTYAHDGNVLAGYTIRTPDGAIPPNPTLSALTPPPVLEGFAFVSTTGAGAPFTFIFSTPSGQYASFDISYIGFNGNWIPVVPKGTLAIVPPAARPSTSDPNYANLGYQLVGLAFNDTTSIITFILSEPAEGRILAAQLDLTTATSGSGVLLPSVTSWPVDAGAWPVSVKVDRPDLHADSSGLFMVQRDGWMTRYSWNSSGPFGIAGSPTQIVGDRSLTRHYAFLLPQSGGPQYMYRFDPASRILTRYKRWW